MAVLMGYQIKLMVKEEKEKKEKKEAEMNGEDHTDVLQEPETVEQGEEPEEEPAESEGPSKYDN